MTRRAKPAEPLLVTDWIPCATPPVRDGVYEAISRTNANDKFMAEYRNGKWFGVGDRAGIVLDAMLNYYQWRGVRRWVLQSLLPSREPMFLIDARPRIRKVGELAKARPFRDRTSAERFAARYARLGLVAVLP